MTKNLLARKVGDSFFSVQLCVLCASVVNELFAKLTTETQKTQRTQRLHSEISE